MLKKSGGLTNVSSIAAIACLCIGVVYGFLSGPTCWQCWSSAHVRVTKIPVLCAVHSQAAVIFEPVWLCDSCKRDWKALSPWKMEFPWQHITRDEHRHSTSSFTANQPNKIRSFDSTDLDVDPGYRIDFASGSLCHARWDLK